MTLRFIPPVPRRSLTQAFHANRHLWVRVTTLLIGLGLQATAGETPITVTEPTGVARADWPVTSGIPLPRGQVRHARHSALFNSDGKQVPLQAEVLGRWPDGSIRWLLIDFQATLAPHQSRRYVLRHGPGVTRKPVPGPPLIISLGSPENRIVPLLKTGPLRIQLAADRFRLLDHVSLDRNGDGRFSDDERLTDDRASGIELVDGRGRRFRADLSLSTWTIEQHGPLRACVRIEGQHGNSDEGTKFRYVVRLHVFRGRPFFRFDYTFINDDPDTLMSRFHSLEVVCSTRERGDRLILSGKPSKPSRLFQLDDQQFRLGDKLTRGHANGWAAVAGPHGGIALGVREFWQNWPKSLEVKPGELRIGLCPDFAKGQYDGRPLKEEVKHYYYLRDGVYTVKIGVAKTHRVWAMPFDGPPQPNSLGDFFRAAEQPLLAQCTPARVTATGVLGTAPPADPRKYHGYDGWLDQMFTKHLDAQQSNRENGMLNFGDWYHVEKFGGGWGNQEYDTSHCFFVQYLRTGDRRYFDRARQGADHLMDVDVVHAVNRHIRGLDHHGQPQPGHIWTHSVGHTGGYYDRAPLEAAWWYQLGMLQNRGHLWLGGLFDDYLLTGNRRALDVARMAADRVASEGGRYSDHLREIGWPLNLLMTAWEATGDDRYLVAAHRHWHMLRDHLNPKRGWVVMLAYGHCSMKSTSQRCRGQNSYLLALTLSALARYHQATGDPEVLKGLSAGLDQMIRECWDERSKAFYGTACTHIRESRMGNTHSTVLLAALAFAHEIRLTGNKRHRRIFRQAFQAAMAAGRKGLESGDRQVQAGYSSRSFHFTPFGLGALDQAADAGPGRDAPTPPGRNK